MKVVLAYNYDPSRLRTGGGITYVHNLVQGLLARGDEVTLFGVSLGAGQTFVHPRFRFVPVLDGTDGFFRFLAALRRRLRREELPADAVVHAHHPLVLGCFLPKARHHPLVCTFHGVTLDWVKVNHGWLSAVASTLYIPRETRILRQTTVITTAGPAPRDGLAKRHPILFARKPVIVTPSGIDLVRFRPLPKLEMRGKHSLPFDAPLVVYAGRFSGQKDLPLLLRAFKELQACRPDARLLMVGRGPLDVAVRRQAQELGLTDIIFKGEVSPQEVPELLSCADAVALTSAYEASPTIVKEALACGVAVVSTDTGDVRSILGPPRGTVVDRDPSSVAQGLAETLDERAKDEPVLREACREYAVAHLGFDAVCEQFRRIYAQAADMVREETSP